MIPLDAVVMLATAFQKDTDPQTVRLYCDSIADIDPNLLDDSIRQIIATSRFFPTVAEIRRTAARLAGLLPPSSGEVLALIRRADVRKPVFRRDGTLAYTERFWEWPAEATAESVVLAEAVIQKAGEPCDEDGKEIFGWETAARGVYESEVPALEAKALANLSASRVLTAKKRIALPPERTENRSEGFSDIAHSLGEKMRALPATVAKDGTEPVTNYSDEAGEFNPADTL